MHYLWLDLETFCETPISYGVHRYAEDAEVMLVNWAIDDGPVLVFDRTKFGDVIPAAGSMFPAAVERALADPDVIVVMHNSGFDRVILKHQGYDIPCERIEDTAVQALSHGLPASLDKLCNIFPVPEELKKHQGGKELIQIFCKPTPKNQKVRRRTGKTDPDKWQKFIDYGGGDIHAMRWLHKQLPRWNYPAREHPLWVLDQKINDRGFLIDDQLAEGAIDAVKRVAKAKDAEIAEQTEGRLKSARQRDALLAELCIEYGVTLPDTQSSTLERRLEDPDLPEPVKELIANRLMVSASSTSKYNKALKAVSSDGRLRGGLAFSGAGRTKRWSGKLFQAQNLPRPDMEQDDIDEAVEYFRAGVGHLFLDDPMRAAWNCIRGLIIAEPGRKIVQGDLSGIESRILPWLAGEKWKLQAWRDYDEGLGPKVYVTGASRLLGIPVDEVTKDQIQSHGKVPDLACLGPHTRVLTNHGVKVITEVGLEDKLWDGVEWVKHDGLIDRGEKLTIQLDGLEITADHQIWAGRWLPASEAALSPSTLRSALATASASLPLFATSEDHKGVCVQFGSNAPAVPTLTLSKSTTLEPDEPLVVSVAVGKRNDPPLRSGSNMKLSCRTSSIADVYVAACLPASIAAIILKTRRSSTTVREASKYGRRGVKIEAFSLPIWLHLKAGISRFLNWTGSKSTKATSPAIFDLSPKRSTLSTDVASSTFSGGSLNWSNVYDIANAGPRNRFTVLTDSGTLIVHNCGYGGASGAFAQFAALYRVEMEPWEVSEAVRLWREMHPAIADWDEGLWAKLDRAARNAISNPGKVFAAGDYIHFEVWRGWMKMHLPSGGFLSYASPRIIPDERMGGTTVSFMGINNYTKKWERITTYGGKLSADATQATARELLAHNLPAIEEAGYPILLLVHDEVVTEPLDDDNYSVVGLTELLTRRPDWIDDKLPLAAGGFESYRYRKE
jgi:hypothetical protein